MKDVPFQANTSDLELSLSFALAPEVTLGLHLLDNQIGAEVGVTFNLPKTTVSISQLATDVVDAQCDKSTGGSLAEAYQADFQHLFQNLTHIATGFEVGVGFEMQAEVSELPKLALSSFIEIATLPVAAMPTLCLAFQSATASPPGFTPAASALKAVQMSASASASASAAAATAHDSSASRSRETGDGFRMWLWLYTSLIVLMINVV